MLEGEGGLLSEEVVYGRVQSLEEIGVEYCRTVLSNQNLRVVVIGAIGHGAGHLRQAEMTREMFATLGLETPTVMVDYTVGESSFWSRAYKKMQQNQRVMQTVHNLLSKTQIFNRYGWHSVEQMGRGKVGEIEEMMQGLESADDPCVLTTHAASAWAVVEYLDKHPEAFAGKKLKLIEIIPDPWRGTELAIMALPGEVGSSVDERLQRVAVVTDGATAQALKQIVGEKVMVLAGGTMSDVWGFERGSQGMETERLNRPMHVMYETAGNYLPKIDEKAGMFIRVNRDRIMRGEMMMTIQAMNHGQTKEYFEKLLSELDLTDAIPILFDEDVQKAVDTRQKALAGEFKYEARFGGTERGRVDVRLTKGGEVPLEASGERVVAVLQAAGHELEDTRLGMKRGWTVLLQNHPFEKWYEVVSLKQIMMKQQVRDRSGVLPMVSVVAGLAGDFEEVKIRLKDFDKMIGEVITNGQKLLFSEGKPILKPVDNPLIKELARLVRFRNEFDQGDAVLA